MTLRQQQELTRKWARGEYEFKEQKDIDDFGYSFLERVCSCGREFIAISMTSVCSDCRRKRRDMTRQQKAESYKLEREEWVKSMGRSFPEVREV